MKDSKGREISIARLDMLTDDEVQQLKDDSWDDFCWKSGNQYARMVHEFCVIEQDKRIRAEEERQVAMATAAAKAEMQRSMNEMEDEMHNARMAALTKSFVKSNSVKKEKNKETPGFGPSGERLSQSRLRELRTGTA